MCKGFLVSHVEIGLQVGTRNLGTVLQLETHLSVTGGIKQLHTFLGVKWQGNKCWDPGSWIKGDYCRILGELTWQ